MAIMLIQQRTILMTELALGLQMHLEEVIQGTVIFNLVEQIIALLETERLLLHPVMEELSKE